MAYVSDLAFKAPFAAGTGFFFVFVHVIGFEVWRATVGTDAYGLVYYRGTPAVRSLVNFINDWWFGKVV